MAIILASPTCAGGIDCLRAREAAERTICSDSRVRECDAQCAKAYGHVRAGRSAGAFAEIRTAQLSWIARRNAQCGGDATCLLEFCRERTAWLDAKVTAAARQGERIGQAGRDRGIDLETLRNARYDCCAGLGDFVLTNGEYVDPKDQNTRVLIASNSDPLVAFGDLDGDGRSDAAVMLAFSGGGSGTWVFLFAMRGSAGPPKCGGVAELGDRPTIHRLSVEDGQIVVDAGLHSPEDGMAETSLRAILRYKLTATGLVEEGFPPGAVRYDLSLDPDAPLLGRRRTRPQPRRAAPTLCAPEASRESACHLDLRKTVQRILQAAGRAAAIRCGFPASGCCRPGFWCRDESVAGVPQGMRRPIWRYGYALSVSSGTLGLPRATTDQALTEGRVVVASAAGADPHPPHAGRRYGDAPGAPETAGHPAAPLQVRIPAIVITRIGDRDRSEATRGGR